MAQSDPHDFGSLHDFVSHSDDRARGEVDRIPNSKTTMTIKTMQKRSSEVALNEIRYVCVVGRAS